LFYADILNKSSEASIEGYCKMETKILVVEDDVVVLNLLVEFLIKSGFKTKSAKSAEEAEEILKNEEINIAIIDIKLPGTDGLQFTNSIKKNII
jgi:DNA-binding response OmpR family regulator